MSQRESGYQRKPLDHYETPAWVTLALIPAFDLIHASKLRKNFNSIAPHFLFESFLLRIESVKQ